MIVPMDQYIEKLDFKFDISRIQDHVKNVILPLKPNRPLPTWGGWGLWTASGDWRHGFEQNGSVFLSGFVKEGRTLDEKSIGVAEREAKARPARAHIHPTELCTGYLQECMESIREAGLNPCRARVSSLIGHGSTTWHRDIDVHHYLVRLHIPVFTNPSAMFQVRDEDTGEEFENHLPADGSAYVVATNFAHRIYNDSDDERIHIFMDITDPTGVTKHHSTEGFRNWCNDRGLEAQFRPLPDYTQV